MGPALVGPKGSKPYRTQFDRLHKVKQEPLDVVLAHSVPVGVGKVIENAGCGVLWLLAGGLGEPGEFVDEPCVGALRKFLQVPGGEGVESRVIPPYMVINPPTFRFLEGRVKSGLSCMCVSK